MQPQHFLEPPFSKNFLYRQIFLSALLRFLLSEQAKNYLLNFCLVPPHSFSTLLQPPFGVSYVEPATDL